MSWCTAKSGDYPQAKGLSPKCAGFINVAGWVSETWWPQAAVVPAQSRVVDVCRQIILDCEARSTCAHSTLMVFLVGWWRRVLMGSSVWGKGHAWHWQRQWRGVMARDRQDSADVTWTASETAIAPVELLMGYWGCCLHARRKATSFVEGWSDVMTLVYELSLNSSPSQTT